MYQPRPAGYPLPLGDFVLTGPLGEGGSGAVYTAQWGHREVALKILHPALMATDRERARFFAEAQRLSEITHPGVVKVLNVGALPDGRPYLAMEKLDGETLAARLSRGRMLVGESLALFGQMVDAVEALHARGLVHRDLKPENVFLVDRGRYAVLLDFGIAKELDAPASTVTQDGGVRGTPAYMAPERFFGQPATPRTDIYELGVVLYAMMVGRLPWDRVADPEARLNPRLPSALGVPLPGRLEAVLQRALSTRPESRPPSARAFLDEVDGAISASGPVRRTADAAAPAPRTTVDLAGPAASAASVETSALGTAPTIAVMPHQPAQAQPMHPAQAQPMHPAQAHQTHAPQPAHHGYHAHTPHAPPPGATTTANAAGAAPRERQAWPWVVGCIAAFCVLAIIIVLATGPSDSNPAAAPDDQAATDDDQPNQLAPRPLPAADDGDDDGVAGDAPRSALSSGSPAGSLAAARHHPADTTFLLVIGARALLANEDFGPLVRAAANHDDVKPLLWAGAMCKVDPLRDVDWVAIGFVPESDDDFDVTVSGDLDRAAIESCASSMSTGPAHVWIDDRTVFFSTRSGITPAWLAERGRGQGSLAATAGIGGVPSAASIWFVGKPGEAFGDVTDGDFPDAESTVGALTLGDEVTIGLEIRYADAATARRAQSLVDKEIADLPQGLLGTLEVARTGERLRLDTRINALITQMIAHMVKEALSAPAP